MTIEQKKSVFVYKEPISQFPWESRQKDLIFKEERITPTSRTIRWEGPNKASVVTTKRNYGTGEVSKISWFPRHQNQQELEMRCLQLYKDGHTQVEIAEMLGISQSRVSQVLRKVLKRDGSTKNNRFF